MSRPKTRSLAYLRRAAAKGRLYATYTLGVRLVEQRGSLIRDERMCAEGCKVLMSAYRAGVHRAGWALAEAACANGAKIELSPKEIAELLLDRTIKRRDPVAALDLWYNYGGLIDVSRLREAYASLARRSPPLHDILNNELRGA